MADDLMMSIVSARSERKRISCLLFCYSFTIIVYLKEFPCNDVGCDIINTVENS